MSVSSTNTYHHALVVKTVRETPTVTTVFFTVNGGSLPFIAGQYISVYFDDLLPDAGKAYSLSSAPSEAVMSITVKNIGVFSQRICMLRVGDEFRISKPFGFFNAQDTAPIIAIAAGVGIAPIWSLVRDLLLHHVDVPISLYITAPTEAELVFRAQLDEIVAVYPFVRVHYYVTQQQVAAPLHGRRFTVARDIKQYAPTARFYICGSEAFVRSMWLQCMEVAVRETAVVTETFFEASL